MQLKTLLNKIDRLKSFIYQKVTFQTIKDQEALVIDIVARKNGLAQCSECKAISPIYDRQKTPRLFQHVPLWGFAVYYHYRMRRVTCKQHGVRVEALPWAQGKRPNTRMFEVFLAKWARRLSWSETANCFKTSWESVYRSVKSIVEYGLERRNLMGVKAIGVDEIQFGQGHNYLTLVYQIDQGSKRLLSVTKERTVRSLLGFFRMMGKAGSAGIQFICSDMWPAYLKVIKKKAPDALHILDRFHIVANLNKGLNEIRATEAKRLIQQGFENVLKNTKYCFLKRPENLTPKQKTKLDEVMKYDLKSVRAFLLKESFQQFWNYSSAYWAEWYLKKWCARAMKSQLEPIKKFVRSMRKHQPLILNWFRAKKAYSSGTVEGLNRKINLITRKSYGFRNFEVLKIALFHGMGDLPEPKIPHRFC